MKLRWKSEPDLGSNELWSLVINIILENAFFLKITNNLDNVAYFNKFIFQ